MPRAFGSDTTSDLKGSLALRFSKLHCSLLDRVLDPIFFFPSELQLAASQFSAPAIYAA